MRTSQDAFTLSEMAIVLTIIGLIIGGVVVGSDIIKAAQLNSVITDYKRYMQATQNFREKYSALPGDMKNATKFWGVAGGDGTGNDVACQTTASTGTATCNGNGDGSMADVIGGTAYYSYENYRFWQHLSNAGLIEGQYTGAFNGGNDLPGSNVPLSKISTAFFALPFASWGPGFYMGGTTYYAGNTKWFAGDFGKNQLEFGSQTCGMSTAGSCPLAPQEAFNIDTKLDDGLPGSGSVIGAKGGGGAGSNCTNMAGVVVGSDAGATYKTANASKDCALFFVRAF